MRPLVPSIACVAALLLAACDGPGAGTDLTRVTVTGSSTVAPVMAAIAKRFEELHPGIRVDVQTGGSSRGIADVRRQLADIGMVSRTLADEERDLAGFTLARDGVCLIVHRDNPVPGLSRGQIVSLYTKRVRNWSGVGGRDGPVTVVNKASGRATLDVFLAYAGLTEADVRADVVIGHNEQAVKTVAGDRNAVAYVSIATAVADAAAGVPIRIPTLDGVAATAGNVADGSFPMARDLSLVVKGAPSESARRLLDFALSEDAHAIIRAHHFVPAAP